MKIPLLDLKNQFSTIRDEIIQAVQEVFESQAFILGRRGKELESRIAAYCGVPWALGVASGTDAILVALRALGVGPGDAVLTTPFTFFATAGAIHNLGAIPVFLDIDPLSFNIDPTKVVEFLKGESCISGHQGQPATLLKERRIRALMPVHLYGQMAPMEEILRIAQEYHLKVVEDAAQSLGSAQEAKSTPPHAFKAGAGGDAGAISFFPSKNLGASGDAGMIVTRHEDVAERVRLLRVHGSKVKYIHEVVGWNSRLDELQAAVLLVKFARLDQWNRARRQNAMLYEELINQYELTAKCCPPHIVPGNFHIYNQFVIRTTQRDKLRQFLSNHDIGSEVYYPVPLHLQRCFSFLGYQQGDFPEAEKAAGEVLALPIFPELQPEQIHYVVRSISDFYQDHA